MKDKLARLVLVLTLAATMTTEVLSQEHPAPVLRHDRTTAILEKNTVSLVGNGTAPISFPVARSLVESDDFLSALQQAYAAMLPEGQSPEFVVTRTAPERYAYVNRAGEHTEIEEVYREIGTDTVLLYLFTEGSRFFGSFEALTVIRVLEVGPEAVEWEVEVFAWPHNRLSRLIARMGLVNRFFRNKTDELTLLAIRIGTFMTRNAG